MIIPNTWRNNKNVLVTTNQCSKHPASIPKFQPANIQHLRHSLWSITRSPVSLNQGDTRQGAYCERSGRPLESNILDLGQNLEIPWHPILTQVDSCVPWRFLNWPNIEVELGLNLRWTWGHSQHWYTFRRPSQPGIGSSTSLREASAWGMSQYPKLGCP